MKIGQDSLNKLSCSSCFVCMKYSPFVIFLSLNYLASKNVIGHVTPFVLKKKGGFQNLFQ